MTLRTKRRLAVIGLALFASWPLVHRGLVARYDVNPWRLFGWAMYCVPDLPTRVQVFAVVAGERRKLRTSGAGAGALAAPFRAYLKRRAVYGRLATPLSLVDRVRREVPEADAIEVHVDRLFLDTRTARIDRRVERYVFDRRS